MFNKLGHYLFKRICKDQDLLKRTRPMNIQGLYVNQKDIQKYINDYMNYGIDYTGDDNISAEDKWETMINEPMKERYWDEPDENEE
tara:strand:- start:457 stop:714 length:258 start_codon:yes stop_codon:yes gene_type:complete